MALTLLREIRFWKRFKSIALQRKRFLCQVHLVDDLERMTDDAIFMKNGGLVMCGKVDELTKHHGKTMTELYKEVYSDCVM